MASEKKKSIESVGLGIGAMFGLYWIYNLFISDRLNVPEDIRKVIGLAVVYGAGLLLFRFITQKSPTTRPEKKEIGFKSIFKCFLLQFTALLALGIIANILMNVFHVKLSNDFDALTPYMLFMLLVFNPIIEEFVFRKLFADKLLKHGELLYILTSSFCFAIAHGVALGIPQVIYTFILGLIWSYLFVKTGDIAVTVVLHSFSNLFGAVIVQFLQKVSMGALGIYFMFVLVWGIIGLILLIKDRKSIVLDGQGKLIRGSVLKEIFTNKGILLYTVLTVEMMLLK